MFFTRKKSAMTPAPVVAPVHTTPTTPSYTEETYTVAEGQIARLRSDAHRMGGVIVLSSPVGAGYQVTVRWPA